MLWVGESILHGSATSVANAQMKSLLLMLAILFSSLGSATGIDQIPKCTGKGMPVGTLLQIFSGAQTVKRVASVQTMVFKQECSRVTGVCFDPVEATPFDAAIGVFKYREGSIGAYQWGELSPQTEVFAVRDGVDSVHFEFVWVNKKGTKSISTQATLFSGPGAYLLRGHSEDKMWQLGMWENIKKTNEPFRTTAGRLDETGCFYFENKISVEASKNVLVKFHFLISGQLIF